MNIELPSAASLSRIAPDKTPQSIFGPMRTLARAGGFEPAGLAGPSPGLGTEGPSLPASGPGPGGKSAAIRAPGGASLVPYASGEAGKVPVQAGRGPASVMDARRTRAHNPGSPLIPAGQTTQLVVGASPESDALILSLAENLYLAYDVRRVYYSAFIPTGSDPRLPAVAKPPLEREHRLYQADWLFRFYGFAASEILDAAHPFLDRRIDPKSDWALRNMQFFPLEIRTAEYRDLLRVPGIGPKSAARVVKARRQGALRASSLSRLGVVMRRAKWFITVDGRLAADESGDPLYPGQPGSFVLGRGSRMLGNPELLRRALVDPAYRADSSSQPDLPWESVT